MTRGTGVLELLMGAALALVALALLTSAVAAGARLLANAGARSEAEDTVSLATEAFTFDVRRAGFTVAAGPLAPLGEARGDRVTLRADLDGDGVIDTGSEEQITHSCALAQRRLSRIAGRQSLPVADDVTRCGFTYRDALGATITTPAAGLSAAERARVRAIQLDLELRPPGLRTAVGRRTLVALRTPESG